MQRKLSKQRVKKEVMTRGSERDVHALLDENQLQFSENLVSHVEMIQKIGEAAESLKACADALKEGMLFYIRATSSRGKIQTGRDHPY